MITGEEGGIRTHGARKGTTVFETARFTQMLASGVHMKVASERLGHSSIGITMDLYSHVLPGMQEEAAERVDNALRAALNTGSQST